jgi:hypothetical protein
MTIRELRHEARPDGIVVDASVTLSCCFPDEQTDSSMGVLDRLQSGETMTVATGKRA